MSDRELAHSYGEGHFVPGKFSYRCYQLDLRGPFVRFRSAPGDLPEVLDVFVSDRASCALAALPSRSFGDLAINGALKLGDSKNRVIELFGIPSREGAADALESLDIASEPKDRDPFGDTELTYYALEPESLHTIIFLRDGLVSAFLISRFP